MRRCQLWFVFCTLVGAIGLVAGFAVSPRDTWLWLVICFLVFSSIVNGMLAWAATFRIAQARWVPVVSRICHSSVAFAPVLLIVLIALLAGARQYMPWTHDPPHSKEAWFSLPFFITRELVMLGLLWGLSLLMVRWSLLADARASRGEPIPQRDHKRLNAIAVGVAWAYVLASSLISYDFVMSFAPEWVSTMFAPYYWCTGLYLAMGVIIVIAATIRTVEPARDHLKPQQFQDTGTLMLAFSLFNMGLFFAQYLTIWYANLPEETFFLLARYVHHPWRYLSWASFIFGYAIAFVLLQSRYIKHRPRILVPIVLMSMLGVALERYVLVVPSLEPHELMLFPMAGLSLLGFVGLFGLTTSWFLGRYPLISSADEALKHIPREDREL